MDRRTGICCIPRRTLVGRACVFARVITLLHMSFSLRILHTLISGRLCSTCTNTDLRKLTLSMSCSCTCLPYLQDERCVCQPTTLLYISVVVSPDTLRWRSFFRALTGLLRRLEHRRPQSLPIPELETLYASLQARYTHFACMTLVTAVAPVHGFMYCEDRS